MKKRERERREERRKIHPLQFIVNLLVVNSVFEIKLCETLKKIYEKAISMFILTIGDQNVGLAVLDLFASVYIFFPSYCY